MLHNAVGSMPATPEEEKIETPVEETTPEEVTEEATDPEMNELSDDDLKELKDRFAKAMQPNPLDQDLNFALDEVVRICDNFDDVNMAIICAIQRLTKAAIEITSKREAEKIMRLLGM